MRTALISLIAGAGLLVAAPAAAQVAGGLTGQLGGNARIDPPRTGPIVDNARETARDARDLTRDSLRRGREVVRDAPPDVAAGAEVDADAAARADRDGAAVDAALRTGVTVRSSDGADLGSIVEVTRNEAGRAVQFLVRSADGGLRMVPTGAVSVDGGAVVTGWSESQFMQRPARRR